MASRLPGALPSGGGLLPLALCLALRLSLGLTLRPSLRLRGHAEIGRSGDGWRGRRHGCALRHEKDGTAGNCRGEGRGQQPRAAADAVRSRTRANTWSHRSPVCEGRGGFNDSIAAPAAPRT